MLRFKKKLVAMDCGLFKQVEIQEETGSMDVGLFNAVITGNVSFFEETGREHFNLEQVTERGNSILHLAAKFGKVEIMKKVLYLQPSLLYMKNCKGNTALHIVAILGSVDMTKLLITSRRRSFDDASGLPGSRVLPVQRMKIDVELCGQLLVMRRREQHLERDRKSVV